MTTTIEYRTGLAALLPGAVAAGLDPDMLEHEPTAAALRILATIRDERVWLYVLPARIDWARLVEFGRRTASAPVRVRIELAASLAGFADARPDLREAAERLDESNFVALLDALRIAFGGMPA